MAEAYLLHKQITELQTINGGVRLDIKMDKEGNYQIADADQTEDEYDLDGKLFEFSLTKEGKVLYKMEEKTRDDLLDLCTKTGGVIETVKTSIEDKKDRIHDWMDFNKKCSGFFHSCGDCSDEEAYNDSNRYICKDSQFCFNYESDPYCGECSDVFGEGCRICSYAGHCLDCHEGYWDMSGICIPKPW